MRVEVTERFGGEPPAARAPRWSRRRQVLRGSRLSARVDPAARSRKRTRARTRRLVLPSMPAAHDHRLDGRRDGTPLEPPARCSRRSACSPAGPTTAWRSQRGSPRMKRSLASAATTRRASARRMRSRPTTDAPSIDDRRGARPARPPRLRRRSVPDGDARTLVPVREERSVDQDLLEDASRSIETTCASEGYRGAQAPHTRQEQRGELVLTFTVDAGRCIASTRCRSSGNTTLPIADIEPLLKIKPGDPFVGRARRRHRRGDRRAVSRARLRAGGGQAEIEVLPEARRPARVPPGRRPLHDRRGAADHGERSRSRARRIADDRSRRSWRCWPAAVLPAAAGRRPRHHRARLPEPGLPERVGHFAAGLCRRAGAGRRSRWTMREGEQSPSIAC